MDKVLTFFGYIFAFFVSIILIVAVRNSNDNETYRQQQQLARIEKVEAEFEKVKKSYCELYYKHQNEMFDPKINATCKIYEPKN